MTLNAAFSPPGRDFAAKAADFLFTTFVDIEKGREHIEDMKQRAVLAKARNRRLHHLPRGLPAEPGGGGRLLRTLCCRRWPIRPASITIWGRRKNSPARTTPEAYRLHRKRFAGGGGTYPLIGTPQHIAGEMVKIQQGRICRHHRLVRQFQGRIAVFHRQGVAAFARSGDTRVKRRVSGFSARSCRGRGPLAKSDAPQKIAQTAAPARLAV